MLNMEINHLHCCKKLGDCNPVPRCHTPNMQTIMLTTYIGMLVINYNTQYMHVATKVTTVVFHTHSEREIFKFNVNCPCSHCIPNVLNARHF